ncbi:hypothetical protein N9C39_09885 [Luminiphilus sp.]|nr:hypothetical protein [Luminiphilus sp.]
MDLPKYVRTITGNALYYDRVVPKRLHQLTPDRRIRIPLGIDASSPLKAIQRAALDAQEEFDARITLLDSSDVSMLQDDVIDKNVAALLRNLNATPGLPGVRMVSIKPDDNEDMRGKGMYAADGSFHYVGDEKESPDYEASLADMVRTVQAINMLHGVDADPIVKGKAQQALVKGMKKKRKRISDLWTAWFDDVANGKTERVLAKYRKYGADLLVLTGDHWRSLAITTLTHLTRLITSTVEWTSTSRQGF